MKIKHFSFIIVGLLFTTTDVVIPKAAHSQRYQPRGSYRETCEKIEVEGNILSALCQTNSGGWEISELTDFNGCYDIKNENGSLECVSIPSGSYQQSCDNARVEGYDLHARCKARNGRRQRTVLKNYYGCQGDIRNRDGYLSCDR